MGKYNDKHTLMQERKYRSHLSAKIKESEEIWDCRWITSKSDYIERIEYKRTIQYVYGAIRLVFQKDLYNESEMELVNSLVHNIDAGNFEILKGMMYSKVRSKI